MDNPLGTGGTVAMEFAKLLKEVYGPGTMYVDSRWGRTGTGKTGVIVVGLH